MNRGVDICSCALVLSSLSRIVAQVALAMRVFLSATRRTRESVKHIGTAPVIN